MSKYFGPLSTYNDHKDDPTYSVEVIITDPAPSFTVIESWGTGPDRTANIFRYGAQHLGEHDDWAIPAQLLPRIIACLSDPSVKAEFLTCKAAFRMGDPKAAAYVELTLPTKLVPKIVAALSDPQVQADFLACIGGSKAAAIAEG